ncbi:hypothetical protein Y032_0007g3262 [Ancylostoma ceylanicum]|uniref:Uncharacterized protein n=1 Tax=Ancylostoma ceylanicum TaxID=53326 RepID=A0A016VP26_9BILA|nr:hypothetical protein Y032_0007g3262 [Ancylostoma ceylanicum]
MHLFINVLQCKLSKDFNFQACVAVFTMVGKYRHRIHGKGRVRIPKGMSSESNPSKKRHRDAAGAARNASLSTEPMVAVDDRPLDNATDFLLADNLESMKIGHVQESCSKSMISEGGVSRISQFTACTNPNFDAVHRIWKSGSSMQKEVVSVLAAVAELIKERNGRLCILTRSTYFCSHDINA